METEIVHIERTEQVAIVRIDRPPANAIELALAAQLEAALTRLTDEANIRAIVFTGTGRFFSAGLDLKIVPTYGVEDQKALIMTINRLIHRLYSLALPTVAAVNGHAIAGGLVTMLTCDYRIGTTASCQMGLTESRVGIPYPAAAMEVVRAELPPAVARTLVLRGLNSGSETALAHGLLDELQSPETLLARAREVAVDLASMPTLAYARIKRQLREGALTRMEEVLTRRSDPLLESWLTADSAMASAEVLARKRYP
ncbi:MAG: enoyl-CoA hydratase/isomerase family protein [Acidobacteria bacterium]|nr:enoyl-CoA hydratase/isomerase family protein [Acidobacteriota bacterium]MBI3657863.1 enoyl-CoA hydratase/isomerase family protein [Acidobacteriota bacterium]